MTEAPPPAELLSARELEILQLVAEGATNKEIAARLYISPNTVKVHLRNIYSKIGVASRTEASMWAVRQGVIGVPTAAPPSREKEEEEHPATTVPSETKRQASARWQAWLGWGLAAAALVAAGVLLWLRLPGRMTSAPPLPVSQPALEASRWQTLTPMPQGRAAFAAAEYNGRLYVIGGDGPEGVTGTVMVYDVGAGEWMTATAKPVPVADVQAAVIGGRIYVAGGRTAEGTPTDVVEVYDPQRNTWSRRAPLPLPLSGYAAAPFEGKWYLFGGWDGQQVVARALMYDPEQDTWVDVPPLPTARAFAGAAVVGGRIHVLGGDDAQQQLLGVNEVFEPVSGTWTEQVALPQPRAQSGVAALADSIFVVGGQGEAPQLAYRYLAYQGTWQTWALPWTDMRQQLALLPLETRLYVLGGREPSGLTAELLTYQALFTVLIPALP